MTILIALRIVLKNQTPPDLGRMLQLQERFSFFQCLLNEQKIVKSSGHPPHHQVRKEVYSEATTFTNEWPRRGEEGF